jgi:hypothetical protein
MIDHKISAQTFNKIESIQVSTADKGLPAAELSQISDT